MLRVGVIDAPRAVGIRIAPFALQDICEIVHILLGYLRLLLKVSGVCLQRYDSKELSGLDIRKQVKVYHNLILKEPFVMIPQNTNPLYRRFYWDGITVDSPRF
jgi:hypothetical protein